MATKFSVSIEATLCGVPKGVEVLPRAKVSYIYRYELQTQNVDGSWSRSIATSDWNTVVRQAEYTQKMNRRCRIVDNGDPDETGGV